MESEHDQIKLDMPEHDDEIRMMILEPNKKYNDILISKADYHFYEESGNIVLFFFVPSAEAEAE